MLRILSLLVTALWCQTCMASEPSIVVVGYLPDYRIAEVTFDQVRGVSHLVYFGLKAPADGRLPSDPIASSTLTKLKRIQRETDCKLLLCVGGWGRSDGFAALTKDPTRQRCFVTELTQYCREQGFAGIDYDWEHPQDEAELAAYSSLIAETKRVGATMQLEVSVAQAGWQNIGQTAYENVDRIHLMAYDHDFPQATLAKAIADVNRLIGWKCPAEKIALGVPFYGRSNDRGTKTYAELTAEPNIAGSANLHDGFAFNGRELIQAKTRFAKEKGLAGLMIWELTQDSDNQQRSLLQAIVNAP